jgi:lipopolysaccharide biosynthesis protein
MRTLVIYVFHQLNDRVEGFFKAIFKDDAIDFLVVCNSKSITLSLPDYVKVLYRENIGYDFGGWSDGILTHDVYKQYDNFIFVNSSVVGPFVPSYYKGKWTDIYIDGLKNDGIKNDVKLFGSTINCCFSVYGPKMIDPVNESHVQSYIFSMDREALDYLIENEIFTQKRYITDFVELVIKREFRMSRLIIEKGWNIGCLMDTYQGIDFTFKTINKQIEYLGDVMLPHNYNKLWTLKELVFIKGNRINFK